MDGIAICPYYELQTAARENSEAFDGRKLDQALLEEMMAGYEALYETQDRYSTDRTDAQRETLRQICKEKALPYLSVYQYVKTLTGMSSDELRDWTPNEEDLYQK